MKRFMKRLREFIERYWAGTAILLGTVALVCVPLLYKLGNLTGGLSNAEMMLRTQVNNDQIGIVGLLHDPFFLPYKLGLYILQLIPLHNAGSLRSVSVALGLVGIIGFYWVIRTWYSRRVAVMSTVLFASSAWLLHVARYASIDSIYIFLFVIVATWAWVKRGSSNRAAVAFALIASALGLYVPGFIWFIGLAIIWQRRTIKKMVMNSPLPVFIPSIVIGLAVITPLVISFISPSVHTTTIGNIKEFLGMPAAFPGIFDLLHNLINIPLQIFVISPSNSLLSVGRLPLLDLFTAAMVLIGGVNLAYNYKLDRSKIIFSILILGSILVSLGGPVHISLLLPFLYILAADGIGYILNEWLATFPRNPVARSVGICVLSLTIALSCAFQLTSYFVAWPHTNIVKSTFTNHP